MMLTTTTTEAAAATKIPQCAIFIMSHNIFLAFARYTALSTSRLASYPALPHPALPPTLALPLKQLITFCTHATWRITAATTTGGRRGSSSSYAVAEITTPSLCCQTMWAVGRSVELGGEGFLVPSIAVINHRQFWQLPGRRLR